VPGSTNIQAAFLQNLTSVATVLLNQAALYKSQLTELPLRLSDLAGRCHMGAVEIANVVRQTSNVHVTYQCAYNSFCIYVGARVFVEMLRQPTSAPNQSPSKEQLEGDLNMMLAALQTFTLHVPLAGHFLMQLQADLNGLEKVISIRPYDVNIGYNECGVCTLSLTRECWLTDESDFLPANRTTYAREISCNQKHDLDKTSVSAIERPITQGASPFIRYAWAG